MYKKITQTKLCQEMENSSYEIRIWFLFNLGDLYLFHFIIFVFISIWLRAHHFSGKFEYEKMHRYRYNI